MAGSAGSREVPFWMQMLLAACGIPIAIAGVWAIGSSVVSYLRNPSATEIEATRLSALQAGRTLESFTDTLERSPAYRVALNDEWSYYMYESADSRLIAVVNEPRSAVAAYSVYPRTQDLVPTVRAGGLKVQLNESSFADTGSLPSSLRGYCGATREGYWEVESNSRATGYQILIPSHTTEAIDGEDPGTESLCPLLEKTQSCYGTDIGSEFIARNQCLTEFEGDATYSELRGELVVNSATLTMPGIEFDEFMVVTPEELSSYQSNGLRHDALPTFEDLQFQP